MIVINATVNSQVEGIAIDDWLQSELFGPISDVQLADAAAYAVVDRLINVYSIKKGVSLSQAHIDVMQHVSRIN